MSLKGLVSQAYPSPEWATFFEVSNATGFGASRRADAIALGIWPSRGHRIIGFEFKEDRRDWLRELKNPAKADTIASHCDEWWLVIGSEGIAKPEELPEPWGLRIANPDRTRLLTVKPCVPFPDRDTSSMKRHFVAAMLRKVTEHTVLKSELDRLIQEAIQKHQDRQPEALALQHCRSELNRLQERLTRFEQASGVKVDGWESPERIGAAVKAVLNCEGTRRGLTEAHRVVSRAHRVLAEALASLPQESA